MDGFLALPGFCPPRELFALQKELKRFIQDDLPTLPPEQVFYEDKRVSESMKQIQQLQQHSKLLGEWMNGKPRTLAEEVLGETVVARNIQYFNKAPGINQPTPAHQDGFYYMLESCYAVTLWLAMDEADEENGCVRYICGSHKRGMRPHARTKTLGFSQGISDYSEEDAIQEVARPAKPGDLLAHHALTIHRADGNQSPTRNRRALGFIFYGKSAQEDMTAHTVYQEELAREMAATGRI